MRPAVVMFEVWNNLLSGTARAALLAGAFAVAVLLPLAADELAVRQLIDSAAAFRTVGGSVLIVTAPGRIDARACEALEAVATVRAAGAMRTQIVPIEVAALPSAPISSYAVSPGLLDVLGASAPLGPGLVVSQQVAEALGARPGGAIATRDGARPVAAVYAYPDDGRRGGLGYAALTPDPGEQPFDECWVDAWPSSDAVRPLLLLAVAPSGDPAAELPTITQLNTTRGERFDGAAAFSGRITVIGPAVAVALAFGAGFAGHRLRRLEVAAALHAGVRHRDALLIAELECAAWMLPGLALAAAVALGFWVTAPAELSPVVLALRIAAPAVAGALIGLAAAVLSARERHLFRYFKQR